MNSPRYQRRTWTWFGCAPMPPFAANELPRAACRLARAIQLAPLTLLVALPATGVSASFDAAPFARPLPEGSGLLWEDQREIHKVVIHFDGAAPAADQVHLEYWGSRWPEQRMPKDREPGGGDVGWMDLGNWYR